MLIPALVFLTSAAGIVYVLFGYPVLLALLTPRFERPVLKRGLEKTVTVIIPVRNGAQWLAKKLKSILGSNYRAELLRVLVISDGSSDDTEKIALGWSDSRVRVISLPPSGKALAVSRGLAEAEGEIVVLTDVRQEFDPDAIALLVNCFADPHVGVATGELIIREGSTSEEYNTGLYWKYEKWIRRNLNRIDAMLGATGSIYAIRAELRSAIPQDILLDDVYLPFKIARQGHRIYFEEQARAYDFPTSLESEFWRKVRTQAGVYQILFHFPSLLWPGNRRFVHFLSHKLGRLLLPFLLIGLAISSFWLPWPERGLAFSAQIAFYAIAALDPFLPEGTVFKRLSSPCRTFVVLVAAAFCAITVFFGSSSRLWKETKVSVATSDAVIK